MDVLKMILIVALAIYLVRKDIFINSFKLHVGVKGIDVKISTKEKSDPPSKDDHFNQN